MKKTISLATFRKIEAAEDAMMRAMMPRTSAVDVAPLTFAQDRTVVVASVGGTRLARPTFATLTYRLAEKAVAYA